MNEEKRVEKEPVLYHIDTSTIALDFSTFAISYSWQQQLEEPSNKDIFPYIRIEKLSPPSFIPVDNEECKKYERF